MTPKEQIIAIAKACGWTDIRECACSKKCHRGFPPDGLDQHLPDYLNDLNAMHEAIAFLNPEEADWFAVELSAIVLENPKKVWWDMNSNEVAQIANATAAQRAEAFLKTLNLWTDDT